MLQLNKGSDKMNNFAERLKLARKKAGLSQEKVSEILSISQSNISKYENGELEPNIKIINLFMDLYKVDANFLFTKTDEEETNLEHKNCQG